jgi:hypothetical protein
MLKGRGGKWEEGLMKELIGVGMISVIRERRVGKRKGRRLVTRKKEGRYLWVVRS